MAKEIMARGPIACGIDASPILEYTGGIASMKGEMVDHVISGTTTVRAATLCIATLCIAILCIATLCHCELPYCAILCHTVPYCAILCTEVAGCQWLAGPWGTEGAKQYWIVRK